MRALICLVLSVVDILRVSCVHISVSSFFRVFLSVFVKFRYPSLLSVQQQRSAFLVGETVSSHTTNPSSSAMPFVWVSSVIAHNLQRVINGRGEFVPISWLRVITFNAKQRMSSGCARVGGGNRSRGCWCGVVTRREPVRSALSVLPRLTRSPSAFSRLCTGSRPSPVCHWRCVGVLLSGRTHSLQKRLQISQCVT